MPVVHGKSPPPRSGSASTPPTMRCPIVNGPPNVLARTSSCPSSRAELRGLLGRARGELEFLQPGALLESLEKRLAGLQQTCHDVGEALAVQYFHSAPWVAWHDAGHNGTLVIEEGEV